LGLAEEDDDEFFLGLGVGGHAEGVVLDNRSLEGTRASRVVGVEGTFFFGGGRLNDFDTTE
jgi:hypothetical protein